MDKPGPHGPSDPVIAGLLVDEVLGRIAAARTELAAGVVDSPSARRLAESIHSLKGLLGQAGLSDLAQTVHHIEDSLVEARRAGGRATLLGQLRSIGHEVRQRVDVSAPEITLREVVATIVAEAERIAARRTIRLDVSGEAGEGSLSRRVAGVLVDAAGHVARNSVVHGGAGGAVAIDVVGEVTAGRVRLTIVDRPASPAATGARPSPDVDSGRGVGRSAAAQRISEVAGHLDEVVSADGWRVVLDVPVTVGTA